MFSPLLEDLFVGNVSGQGRLSPRGKVTMSKTDKRVAAIPVEATSFSFLYPLPNLADALSLLDMATPVVGLLSVGGFVYWDEQGKVCGVNALQMGHGLHFAGPFLLQTQPGCRPLREKLHAAGRVVKVTLGALVACGVMGFCWILPGETFDDEDHDLSKLWPHGGYVYFYSDESRRNDCLYKVTEAPQKALDETHRKPLTRQNVAGPQTSLEVAEIVHAKTLGSLGPFRPTPIDFVSLGFTRIEANEYGVSLKGSDARSFGFPSGVGKLSPEFQITLSTEIRKEVGIPDAATSFAFGYPMRDLMAHLAKLDVKDARAAFLAVGGFVYFGSHGKVVGVNSLASGYGLHFAPKALLCDLPGGKARAASIRRELISSGRAESVQLPSLRDCGALSVCWVLPGECLGGADAVCADGAFIYLFEDTLAARDCIYVLQGEAPLEQRMRQQARLLAVDAAKRSKNAKEADLVEELYGNDMLATLQRTVAAAPPKPAPRKIGTLGPFKNVPVADYAKVGFGVVSADDASGGSYAVDMRQLPAPPPPIRSQTSALLKNQRLSMVMRAGEATAAAPEEERGGGGASSRDAAAEEVLASGSMAAHVAPSGPMRMMAPLKKLGGSIKSLSLKATNIITSSVGLTEATPPLAAGWNETVDDQGRTYYWSVETRETRWTRPEAIPEKLATTAPETPASVFANAEEAAAAATAVDVSEDAAGAPPSMEMVRAASSVEAISMSGGRMDMARLVFKKYDVHRSGSLTESELQSLFVDLGYEADMAATRLAMRILDRDGNCEIDVKEFSLWWHHGEKRWDVIGLSSSERGAALQQEVAFFDAFHPAKGVVLFGKGVSDLHASLSQFGRYGKDLDAFLATVGTLHDDGKSITLTSFLNWANPIAGEVPRAPPPLPPSPAKTPTRPPEELM